MIKLVQQSPRTSDEARWFMRREKILDLTQAKHKEGLPLPHTTETITGERQPQLAWIIGPGTHATLPDQTVKFTEITNPRRLDDVQQGILRLWEPDVIQTWEDVHQRKNGLTIKEEHKHPFLEIGQMVAQTRRRILEQERPNLLLLGVDRKSAGELDRHQIAINERIRMTVRSLFDQNQTMKHTKRTTTLSG